MSSHADILGITEDGSRVRADGTVAFFSIERFVRDICVGGACFMCGRFRSEIDFDDEHVIPRWLLRRHGLFDSEITLTNDTLMRYRSYTVPCCVECNRHLGRVVEEPISKLFAGGHRAVASYLDDNGPEALFCWLGLIFFKIHLRDRQLRRHRDQRFGGAMLGDVYDWEYLHHVHCLARAPLTGCSVEPEAIGTFMCVKTLVEPDESGFDYGDIYGPATVFLQSGDVAIVTVLDDACGAWTFFRKTYERLNAPLSSIQVRELAARVAFLNASLKERPTFMTLFPPGPPMLCARTPQVAETKNLGGRVFGETMYHFCGRIAEGKPSWSEIEEPLREGRYSWLLDREGNQVRHEAGEPPPPSR
jgi:hypothetical protein